jgi:chromosome segregation protein
VSDVDSAQAAIELLKADDAGRAALLVGGADMPAKGDRPALPEGAAGRWTWWRARTHARRRGAAAADVVFAPDLATARTIVSYAPELRTVTPAGDLLGAYAAAGGSAKQPSFIEVQAAVEEARRTAVDAETGSASCGELERSRRAGAARDAVARPRRRKEAEGERNAAARRLAETGRGGPVGQGRGGPHRAEPVQAEQARDRDLAGSPTWRSGCARAVDPDRHGSSTVERDELASAVPAAAPARDRRTARRAHRRGAGRRAGRPGRRPRPPGRRRARGARPGRGPRGGPGRGAAIAARRRRRRRVRRRQAGRRSTGGRAPRRRRAGAVGRESSSARCARLAKQLAGELERLTSKVHRDEVARAEQRMRVEQLEARRAEEFGLDARRCWRVRPAPAGAADRARDRRGRGRGRPAPSRSRSTAATRRSAAAKAERELTLLGKVNPLALEEFAAHGGAVQVPLRQLEDVKAPAGPAHRGEGCR